jgi:hypothetical protein
MTSDHRVIKENNRDRACDEQRRGRTDENRRGMGMVMTMMLV